MLLNKDPQLEKSFNMLTKFYLIMTQTIHDLTLQLSQKRSSVHRESKLL